MKEEIDDLGGDDDTWMIEAENLKIENDALKDQKSELETRLEDLRDEVSTARAKANSATEEQDEELQTLRDDLERLRRRLKDTVSAGAYSVIQEENEDLRRERNKLREDLEQIKDGAESVAGAEELMTQIRELDDHNRRLEKRLREQAAVSATSPGTLPAVDPAEAAQIREAFDTLNSMVSGWRANLEAVQIHVGDLTELFDKIGATLDATVSETARAELQNEIDDVDPEWACESLTETVEQILGDSKRIKTILLDVRDQLKD